MDAGGAGWLSWRAAAVAVVAWLALHVVARVADALWWRPRRLEAHFAAQGVRGPPYRFLLGSVKEMVGLMAEASSKPMSPPTSHNALPRVLAFYHYWRKIYGAWPLLPLSLRRRSRLSLPPPLAFAHVLRRRACVPPGPGLPAPFRLIARSSFWLRLRDLFPPCPLAFRRPSLSLSLSLSLSSCRIASLCMSVCGQGLSFCLLLSAQPQRSAASLSIQLRFPSLLSGSPALSSFSRLVTPSERHVNNLTSVAAALPCCCKLLSMSFPCSILPLCLLHSMELGFGS